MSPEDLNRKGDAHFKGVGVEKSLQKAFEYYKEAAEKGLAIA